MSRPLLMLATLLCGLCLGREALGKPPYKDAVARHYGTRLVAGLKACATCHVVPPGTTDAQLAESDAEHNAFGKRLRELGEQLTNEKLPATIPIRLARIADEDSDGDGVANELEIFAGTRPGDPGSLPAGEDLASGQRRQAEYRAEYHWEPWRPVQRPTLPDRVVESTSSEHPIDRFLTSHHRQLGLVVRPEASPLVLLRRVHLDLIGLPPSPEDVHAFQADPTAAAYEKIVDRLLASPAYGQRWGRHWMDVWRYSDWAGWGNQVRDSRPHVWRWRDWIVESLNADKPYDRMVMEMLAADELAPEDVDALRATGFLVRNFKLLSREQWITDTVNHTSKAFLGITLDCCRCHDHMYDPLPQVEYYQFRAVFEPHNVRTDRIPGQVNVDQAGLVRVFDADPNAKTLFFVRGDERQADKDRPMSPGVPAALGSANFAVQEISLPASVRIPDQRSFVQDDDLEAASKAIVTARKKLDEARQKLAKAQESATAAAADAAQSAKARQAVEAAQIELRLAELDVPIAETRRTALAAVISLERLDADGLRQRDPAAWQAVAKTAVAAQRQEALAEKRRAQQVAGDAQAKTAAALAAATTAQQAKPEDAAAKAEFEKAAKAADDARMAAVAAAEAVTKAQATLDEPLSAEFTPRKLNSYPDKSTGRRLALARWITDPQNPLAARVAVNQLWMRHFGQPLVGSVFDFGNNGQAPVIPELVDWLAAEFMQPSLQRKDGAWQPTASAAPAWSMKHMHRLIVTSAAYRRASTNDATAAAIDPDNRYFWQMPTRRLEAEAVRDCVLHVAGQLDESQGGPDIDYEQGLTSRRRSMYFRHAPEKQMTFLRLFDAASPNECYRRKESIVPQQALALVNSPLAIEQSRRLARKLFAQQMAEDALVDAAFVSVLSRSPRTDELQTCTSFLAEQRALFQREAARLTATAADPMDVTKPAADGALRAYENLVLVLINHNDFVTVR